ncbi:MAG: tryptophan--tRNA ligase, partial [Gammaproteobacteria bacterium]
LECKQPIIDAVLNELAPIQKRASEYEEDIQSVRAILRDGAEEARDIAAETLKEVRAVIGLNY